MNPYEERSAKKYAEYLKLYKNEANAEFLALRLMCQTDLYWLAAEIFKMKDARGKNGRKRWYPPIHGRLCDQLQREDDSLIHLSRGMMKTTVGEIWCVQKILQDPAVRIGMWSKNIDLMKVVLKSVKQRFQNEQILELFPDIVPPKKQWEIDNAESLTLFRPKEGFVPKEAQIEVFGVGASATGRHYDYHYYDDVIDDKNVSTADQIAKVRDWWGAVQAIKDPGATEKVIGTPWHSMDLYATIREDNLFEADQILVLPGVTEERILYPFFTKEFLRKQERQMGPYLYSAQYLLNTIPKSDRLFAPPYPEYQTDDFPEKPIYYMAIDPSLGKGRRHDSTGICVGAVDKDVPQALYFVEADKHMLQPDDLASAIVDRLVRYKPKRVGIETGLQEYLHSLIMYKIAERKRAGVGVKMPEWLAIPTGGGPGAPSKADKINRTIGALVRQGRAYFLPSMKNLFKQMRFFNPNAQKNDDDILDAAHMLVRTVPNFSPGNWLGQTVKNVAGYTMDMIFGEKKKGSVYERLFKG